MSNVRAVPFLQLVTLVTLLSFAPPLLAQSEPSSPSSPTESSVDVVDDTPVELDEEEEVQVVEAAPSAKDDSKSTTPSPSSSDAPSKWYDHVTLSPFAVLRASLEFSKIDRPSVQLFRAGVKVVANYKPFTLVFEPHFLNEKSRSFFPSNVTVRQAFLKWDTPVEGLSLSGGLLYNRLGYFWDDSFFGNPVVYMGKRLDTDYNLELAYNKKFSEIGVNMWLQLSPGGDGTNIALLVPPKRGPLQGPGDVETDDKFKEALAARLRVEPSLTISDFTVTPAVFAEYTVADRAKGVKYKNKVLPEATGGVIYTGADLTLRWRNMMVLGEFAMQLVDKQLGFVDKSLERFYYSAGLSIPVFAQPDSDWWKVIKVTAGYGHVDYKTEQFTEDIARAGIDVVIHKNVRTTVEYARWSVSTLKDPMFHRIELLLYANF